MPQRWRAGLRWRLINTKFNINAASRELFSHIVTAAQMECFENGLMAEVHQLSHFNRKSKTAYVSLMDDKTTGLSVAVAVDGVG